LFASQAQAQLINVDLRSSFESDRYDTGAAVFGTASSQWNELVRNVSATNVSLTDDTGAATSVQVSYTRNSSGIGGVSGAFANLGISSIGTGTVTLSGLLAGAAYQLAIFSALPGPGTPSFTVGGSTQTITSTTDWSSLNAGAQYVLFPAVADGSGQLSFTPNANYWSAFELQSGTAASVPEPGSAALLGIGCAAGFAASRRRKAA
jgi:hypothetical protein